MGVGGTPTRLGASYSGRLRRTRPAARKRRGAMRLSPVGASDALAGRRARGHAPAARWRRRGPRRPPHRRSARNRGPRWSDNGSRYYQIRNTYDADLHIRAPPGGGGVPINDIDNPPPPRRPPPVRRYITYYQKLNPGIVNLRQADRAARHERAVAPPSRPRCGTVPGIQTRAEKLPIPPPPAHAVPKTVRHP